MSPLSICLALYLCCLVLLGINASPTDIQWAWISGTKTAGDKGTYDVKGIASANYYPSARMNAIGWYDSNRRELWLFGGDGEEGKFCHY